MFIHCKCNVFPSALSFGGYEKVCVLFNIAAMQSGIAAQQSVESDEGLKGAAKLYQVTPYFGFTVTQLGSDLHVEASFISTVNVTVFVSF